MKAKANAKGAVDPQIHVRKKVAGGATGALVVDGVVGPVAGALAEKPPVKKGRSSPSRSTVTRKKHKISPHVRGKRMRQRTVKV